MKESEIDIDVKQNAISDTKHPELKIDQIFNNINYLNKLHMRVYFIILLVLMADGGEGVVVSFLLSILEKQWKMSTAEKGLFGTFGAIGAFFGGIITGRISDKYGRKITYVIGNLITAIFSCLLVCSQNLLTYAIFRISYGFGLAMSITAAASLATELSPAKIRGWILNLIWVLNPIGELYCAISADYFLVNSHQEDSYFEPWRKLLFSVAIPITLSSLLSLFVIESPRFLLSKKRFNEAFSILDRLLISSNKNVLTEEDKKELINEAENEGGGLLSLENSDNISESNIKNNTNSPFKILFNSEFILATFLIGGIYFINSSVWSGLAFIMPKAIEVKEAHDFNSSGDEIDPHAPYVAFIISAIFEIPCTLMSSWLAENKHLKRKGSLVLSFIICCIPGILICLPIPGFKIYFIIIKFIIVIPFSIIFIYCNEIYPTKIRSTALGLQTSVSRISAIVSPILVISLFDIGFILPFIFIAIILIFGVFLSAYLPKETHGMNIK